MYYTAKFIQRNKQRNKLIYILDSLGVSIEIFEIFSQFLFLDELSL